MLPVFTDDRRILTFRLGMLQYVIAVAFAGLGVCFWMVQVLQHAKFLELAENNHHRTLPLRAPRGMLFDRNGHVLVENRDALNISLVRENKKTLDHSISLLAEVAGVQEPVIRDILDHNRKVPAYRPVVIIQDASLTQVSAIYARRHELPDVLVEQVPTRRYPQDDLLDHRADPCRRRHARHPQGEGRVCDGGGSEGEDRRHRGPVRRRRTRRCHRA